MCSIFGEWLYIDTDDNELVMGLGGTSTVWNSLRGLKNEQVQEFLFITAVILLPFQMVPQPVAMQKYFPLLSFPHAAAYPVALGILCQLFVLIKEKRWAWNFVAGYFFILFSWLLVSSIGAVIKFPYNQIAHISQSEVIKWTFKYGFGSVVVTSGTAIWVYSLFRNRWGQGLLLLRQGLFYSFILAGGYSIVEVLYLFGSDYAGNILKEINPYIYSAKIHHGWWPPLLWPGQVRSVSPEPSFFGIYASAVFPFLVSYLFEKKRVSGGYVLAILWLIFLVFLTKARTALILLLGEVAVLTVIIFFMRKTDIIKKFAIILTLLCVAYMVSDYILINSFRISERSWVSSQSVIKIVSTATQSGARSNETRFALQLAEWNMFLDQPVLGVGPGLSGLYFEKYLPDLEKCGEVKGWVKSVNDNANYRVPVVNTYTNKLAEWGLGGLFLFVVPLICIIFYAVKKRIVASEGPNKILEAAFFVSFVGACMGLLSTGELSVFSFDVLLGLGFCFLEQQLASNNVL